MHLTVQTIRVKAVWFLAACQLLLPYITINGKSSLRFDVPTQKLYFFGTTIWIQEFFIVALGLLFVILVLLILTLIFGRVWCGWFCPQTIITSFTGKFSKLKSPSLTERLTAHSLFVVVSFLTGFTVVSYFVSPYEAWPQIAQCNLGPVATGCIAVFGGITYLNLVFLGRKFCATICPYAKIQGALTDSRSLIITLDEERRDECLECGKCQSGCPTGLDIRQGMQVGCIMCATCISKCTSSMKKVNKDALVQYRFGSLEKASLGKLFRPAVVILTTFAIVVFSAFPLFSLNRTSFSFDVSPHPVTPRYTKDGEILNGYILSIRNRRDEDIMMKVTLSKQNNAPGLHHSATKPLLVPAGVEKRYPLFLRSKSLDVDDQKMNVTLQRLNKPEDHLVQQLHFIQPKTNL